MSILRLALRWDDLGGERLVDLHDVDAVDRHPGTPQGLTGTAPEHSSQTGRSGGSHVRFA